MGSKIKLYLPKYRKSENSGRVCVSVDEDFSSG